ncbi:MULTISPECIES: DUF6482 family protein [Salinicola]|uniref:DUF6482 family protein n=1 Tax=Salinicola TaxID=404432 RepID=UPI000AD8F1C1|nr:MULTISPECIES: DUF6482 family protein [Salinicola]
MTYGEFVQLAREGRVAELDVEPSTSQSFQYRAHIDGQDVMLTNDDGTPICDNSLGHARQRLRSAVESRSIPLYLVQQSPGTLMVGDRMYSTTNKTRLE